MSKADDRVVEESRRLARRYRITSGKRFRLSDVDPGDTGPYKNESKDRSKEALVAGIAKLEELQEKLYAQNRWGVLLIFQALDAAGKDSAIEHVMSGVNPQGCQVYSFKAPSSEELDHDFLWRCAARLPERGRIGIFNRSYYEEVLVVRVHPQFLEAQHLPPELVTDSIWGDRFDDIRGFERYLGRNGIAVRKFFLHVSRKEQKKRFLARIDDPAKNWKFGAEDLAERAHWREYMRAYEDVIRHTATSEAPWYVIPADHKWFTRLVVAAAVVDTMAGLKVSFPTVGAEQKRELQQARAKLLRE